MPNNFKNDVDDYLKRLKKVINKSKQNMAKAGLNELIKSSPVWTGAYIKSHKVTANKIDSQHEPVIEFFIINQITYNFGPKMLAAAVQALKIQTLAKLATKISATDFNDTIYISNSIPYANQIEYLGWEKSGPYHTFGRATMAIKTKTFLKSKSNAPIGI
jgi:hypothetical protein